MNKSKTHSKSPRCALAILVFAGAALLISALPLWQAQASEAPPNSFEEPLAKDQVRLLGQVEKTGAYVVSARSTVLEVIQMGGGFAPGAKKGGVQVWRTNAAGKKDIKIFDCAHAAPESSAEKTNGLFVVLPGDTIFVPPEPGVRVVNRATAEVLGKDQVKVMGQVDKPGIYSINSEAIVLDSIRFANGFTNAAKSNAVQIIRKSVMGVKETMIVDCNATQAEGTKDKLTGYFALQPGDVIFVPEAPR